jgi:hypothetical protein
VWSEHVERIGEVRNKQRIWLVNSRKDFLDTEAKKEDLGLRQVIGIDMSQQRSQSRLLCAR